LKLFRRFILHVTTALDTDRILKIKLHLFDMWWIQQSTTNRNTWRLGSTTLFHSGTSPDYRNVTHPTEPGRRMEGLGRSRWRIRGTAPSFANCVERRKSKLSDEHRPSLSSQNHTNLYKFVSCGTVYRPTRYIAGHFGDYLPTQLLDRCKNRVFPTNCLADTSKRNLTTTEAQHKNPKSSYKLLQTCAN